MFLASDTKKMDDVDFLSTGCLPLEYPVYGSGDMRDPAFHVQFERGKYKRGNRPVLINNREGTYRDFTEEKLLEIAKDGKEYTGAFLMQVGVARLRIEDHDSEIEVFLRNNPR